MKDLRAELTERLEAVTSERRRLTERDFELEELERAIKVMLAEEARRFVNQTQLPMDAPSAGRGTTELGRFLRKTLLGRALTLDEVANIADAEGLDFNGKNPKRTLNFALLGMLTGGYAAKIKETGQWRLTEKGNASAA